MLKRWQEQWNKVEPLKSGGQGATWLVRNRISGETGVLKTLHRKKDAKARHRFKSEVANLDAVWKAGGSVPRVIESNADQIDEHDAEPYLVMERIEGGPLSKQVIFTRAQPHLAVRFTLSLCRTLAIAHGIGVVHRDIKPDNLLLRSHADSEVVVVDFGLSFNEARSLVLTSPEEIVGNRFLLLPEGVPGSGDVRDVQPDVTRAVGLLFYLLTGRTPYMLRDAHDRPPHHRGDARDLIVKSWPERRDAVLQVFDRGFAHDPRYRFTNVAELTAALEALGACPRIPRGRGNRANGTGT
jgi:serine/threonine-protein kinase